MTSDAIVEALMPNAVEQAVKAQEMARELPMNASSSERTLFFCFGLPK